MSDASTDQFEISVTGSDGITAGCSDCPPNTKLCQDGYICSATGGTCITDIPPIDSAIGSWIIENQN